MHFKKWINVLKWLRLFHDRAPYLIETSPLICRAKHWTGFFMIGTSVMKELIWKSRTTPSTISNFLIVNFKQIQVIKGFLYFSYKLRRLGKRGNILIPTQTILIWGPIWIEAGLRWKILVSLYICFLVRVYVRNLTWKLYLSGFQFNQLCKSFLQKTFRPEFSMETVPQPEFTYSMSTIETREQFVKFVQC